MQRDRAEGRGKRRNIQPARTVGAAVIGATLGTVALGGVVGWLVSDGGGLATLGAVIVAAGVGALSGVSVAVAVELRDRPLRYRAVTVLTVLVAGPPLCGLVAWGLAQTVLFDDLDTRHLFVVWIGFVLPATALLGRWIASRVTSAE